MPLIRCAEERDLDRICVFLSMNLEYFSPDVLNFFRSQWPGGQILAEDVFGNLLGVLCGSVTGKGACISLFAVDKGSRRKGVGSSLLEAFCRECFMRGYRTVTLEVRTDNMNAIAFYESKGFFRTEFLSGFYNDGGDAYRMELRICRTG